MNRINDVSPLGTYLKSQLQLNLQLKRFVLAISWISRMLTMV